MLLGQQTTTSHLAGRVNLVKDAHATIAAYTGVLLGRGQWPVDALPPCLIGEDVPHTFRIAVRAISYGRQPTRRPAILEI